MTTEQMDAVDDMKMREAREAQKAEPRYIVALLTDILFSLAASRHYLLGWIIAGLTMRLFSINNWVEGSVFTATLLWLGALLVHHRNKWKARHK